MEWQTTPRRPSGSDLRPSFSRQPPRLGKLFFSSVTLGFNRPNPIGGRLDTIGAHLLILGLVADGATVDDLHHRASVLPLEFLVHLQHRLCTVTVESFNAGLVSLLDRFVKKLLQHLVLLLCCVS